LASAGGPSALAVPTARGGGVRCWISATRHPQCGMRPFRDRAAADVGSSVQCFRGIFESSRRHLARFVLDRSSARSEMLFLEGRWVGLVLGMGATRSLAPARRLWNHLTSSSVETVY